MKISRNSQSYHGIKFTDLSAIIKRKSNMDLQMRYEPSSPDPHDNYSESLASPCSRAKSPHKTHRTMKNNISPMMMKKKVDITAAKAIQNVECTKFLLEREKTMQ